MNLQVALRPDAGGSVGRKIALLANHYKLDIRGTNAYHYDVNIKQQREERYGIF